MQADEQQASNGLEGRQPGAPSQPAGGAVLTEMNAADRQLLQDARGMLSRAYSPYSKVCVGAALSARPVSNGQPSGDAQTFVGCNVENASYGLTFCGERSAVVAAVGAGCRHFESMALMVNGDRILMPCGACRQFMAEFAPDLRLLITCGDDENFQRVQQWCLSELLPFGFAPSDLGVSEQSH